MIDEAVVICTRNRPEDVRTLLDSLADQQGMDHRLVVIVDASDDHLRERTEAAAAAADGLNVEYRRFEGPPSLARQRNFAVESLHDEIEVVHFLDDDVTLEPGCLDRLSSAMTDDRVGGVGGSVRVPGKAGRKPTLRRRLFLLDSKVPGVVLISGASTPAQDRSTNEEIETEWLGGCAMSYRRTIILEERFDEDLEGYSLDEDVDFSYRVSRRHPLKVIPDAVIYHHESADGRGDPRTYARTFLIHRYWFLEKNIRHPLRKAAFWWSALGRLLATRFSSSSARADSFAGLLDGIRAVWRRDHRLLTKPRRES